jgi:hypothetical protein
MSQIPGNIGVGDCAGAPSASTASSPANAQHENIVTLTKVSQTFTTVYVKT